MPLWAIFLVVFAAISVEGQGCGRDASANACRSGGEQRSHSVLKKLYSSNCQQDCFIFIFFLDNWYYDFDNVVLCGECLAIPAQNDLCSVGGWFTKQEVAVGRGDARTLTTDYLPTMTSNQT